jgi:hypothetical protein
MAINLDSIDQSDLDDFISIHAPNEGSDTDGGGDSAGWLISIHAPNEGSDGMILMIYTI